MAATRERVHTYLLIKGAGPAERIIVWDTQDVSLGRASENDIAIDDAVLSRRHAEFYRSDGGWAVKDLGTSNGTSVNGETIRTRTLANKDVVRIGEIEISFIQVAKNPAAIGKPVEYASQLKNFGGAAGQAKDGEATMLGLMQTVDEGDDDDFIVGKANDFDAGLDGMREPASRSVPRDLDLELGGLEAAAPAPPKPAARAAAPKPAPRVAPSPSDWSLDDMEPPAAPKPQPQPQARPAVRAAAPAAATAAAPAPASRTVALQLEIDGLSGDLRRVLESLLGKVIELPPLRIRVKRDDLG
jgi:predicted component of type VI protein secretion system